MPNTTRRSDRPTRAIKDPHGMGFWRFNRRKNHVQWAMARTGPWHDTADILLITAKRITTFMVLKANAGATR